MYNKIFDNKNTVAVHEVPGSKYPLEWNEELGIGYLKSDGYDYGEAYWANYCKLSASDFGTKLTELRASFVKKSLNGFNNLCDVGVGSGQFVDTVKCKGSDVNPLAIKWLKEHNYYTEDPRVYSALSLWDVLEHIDDPRQLLEVANDVFLSTPIYKDAESCLKSKHLKPGEHIWYFTDRGIKHFMDILGYSVRDESDFETVLGRESILSYHFRFKSLG